MGSDQRLRKKIDQEAILEQLNQLSGSEFNSFLLKMYQDRAARLVPGELMRQFRQSRFTKGADVNPLAYKQLEIRSLQAATEQGFVPFEPSPLTPLGTCSAIARVNQNNVVSATRSTEVVSDLTNVLAMKVAEEHAANGKDRGDLHYAATQRIVRAQAFDDPAYAAHFGILCMVGGGFARSSFELELDQLFKHLHFHHSLMQRELREPDFYTVLMLKQKDHLFNDFLKQRLEKEPFDFPIKLIQEENPNQYYQLVQYKSFAKLNGEEINLSDGGLVDWTQKLIPNKKHRLFISATDIELIHKLFQ